LAAAAIITAPIVAIILNAMTHLPHLLFRFSPHLSYANESKRVIASDSGTRAAGEQGKFLSEIICMKDVSKLPHSWRNLKNQQFHRVSQACRLVTSSFRFTGPMIHFAA
jgi:hypothetical protein